MSETHPSKLPQSALDVELVEDAPDLKQASLSEKAFTGHSANVTKSKDEKRLIRKLDLTVVPLSALIYFVAYLDRNSIGNARLMGLEKDLGLTPDQFYNCLTMFFVGYIVFMLPGNICQRLPHVSAPILIGGSVILFGAFCAGLGDSQNYATVLTLRVFVGASQAFIQGLGLYASFWYKRDELATRSGIGLIAYGVQKDLTNESTGLGPWRWLFIIEGIAAMSVGVVTIFVIPRFADKIKGRKNWLLTPTDVHIALERAKGYNTVGANVDVKQIWTALKDPKSWLFACINAGVALGIASVGNFLPTFVRSFGYSPARAQLFTVIPYACATLSTISVSYFSDRLNLKGPCLIVTLSVACVGYVILLTVYSIPVLVFATCLITAGLYPSVILLTSWLGVNTAGFTKRGTAWAMAEIFGQCFSIMGTHVYTNPPRFVKGHAIVLGFLLFGIVCATTLICLMSYLNKRRAAELERYSSQGELHPDSERSLEEAGDHHLSFQYIL
ncbi:hypothetical protein H2200_010998 [Cladophialophora chaetospira]|uniref:Major facilitator superfamily (MFS) profile domain-containing protein n=1 Tax=Cladophialophora chaetospira TaxID=386627 RepID=A0AA39CE25_9EURO|nr:hypothetical protein H2200_010998 [Cladophialophora chaetospira]